jgi:flagellar biosynthesis/type III secretory pathway M-ring protein FliF/YscJ
MKAKIVAVIAAILATLTLVSNNALDILLMGLTWLLLAVVIFIIIMGIIEYFDEIKEDDDDDKPGPTRDSGESEESKVSPQFD